MANLGQPVCLCRRSTAPAEPAIPASSLARQHRTPPRWRLVGPDVLRDQARHTWLSQNPTTGSATSRLSCICGLSKSGWFRNRLGERLRRARESVRARPKIRFLPRERRVRLGLATRVPVCVGSSNLAGLKGQARARIAQNRVRLNGRHCPGRPRARRRLCGVMSSARRARFSDVALMSLTTQRNASRDAHTQGRDFQRTDNSTQQSREKVFPWSLQVDTIIQDLSEVYNTHQTYPTLLYTRPVASIEAPPHQLTT